MRTRFLIVLLSIIFRADLAAAYSILMTGDDQIVRWGVDTIHYYLDADGTKDVDVKDGSDIAAVEESFRDWQDVSCSRLRFVRMGETTDSGILPVTGKANGRNELMWIEDSQWKFGKYPSAVTVPLYSKDGKIVEVDIGFNGLHRQWSTTGQGSKSDVKSVVIHEIGHMIGLQHVLEGYSQWNPPTMVPYADPNLKSRTLEEDDRKGVCFLYPSDGAYACSKDGDCPSIVGKSDEGGEFYSGRMTCKNSRCDGVITAGSKAFGDGCSTGFDCKEPYFCQPLSSGGKICSRSCDPETRDCPAGFKCEKYTYSKKGYCAPGLPVAFKKRIDGENGSGRYCSRTACKDDDSEGMTPRQLPKDEGDLCGGDGECKSGTCFPLAGTAQSYCRTKCDKDNDQCAAGSQCVSYGSPDRSVCMESRKGTGEGCVAHDECTTGICFIEEGGEAGFCALPCISGRCPGGGVCLEGTAFGDICLADNDLTGSGRETSSPSAKGTGPFPSCSLDRVR